MKYNEKVERYAPKLGRKNLASGLSCPPFVYMDDSDDGMWVHYAKYCENIAKQKYKRCLAMARWCKMSARENDTRMCLPMKCKLTRHEEYLYFINYYHKWHRNWLALAEKFKEAK